MANIDPDQMMFKIDNVNGNPTINGNQLKLVATQQSRRSRRKRTVYIYHIVGTKIIIFNRSRSGIYFMKIAIRPQNVENFYNVFVNPPLTTKEKEWLTRYDYQLV